MSVMSNIATCVELAFASFTGEVPPLIDISDIKVLRAIYESQDAETHWFDKETLDFFGSSNLKVCVPGITVENQLNAPDGVERWSVTAWVIHDGRISPRFIDRFHTQQEAILFSETLYAQWNEQ
jgi:hypothetical protein